MPKKKIKKNTIDEEKKKEKVDDDIEQTSKTEKEEEDLYDAIIPPNGGWGWVIVACAFYCNLVVDGIQLTFGIFLKSISDYFNTDYASVSLAGSMMFGLHFLMGPVCAGFTSAFGIRPVTVIGCLISSFGIGISYFANNTYYLCFSYGFLGGVGLGLVYMNTLVITTLYFTTLMPIALAFVVCGTGVGTVVFALLGDHLIQITTWQFSFLGQSIFALSMGLAALSFKPLNPVKVKLTQADVTNTEPSKKPFFIKRSIRKSSSSVVPYQSSVWSTVQEQTVINSFERNKTDCKCCKKRKPLPETTGDSVLLLSEVKEVGRRRISALKDGEGSMVQIFKAESEKQIKDETSQRGSTYTTVYTKLDLGPQKDRCDPMKRTLKAMLDFRLLRSGAFCLYSLSGALQTAALLVVYIYEKDRALKLGISPDMTVYLIICLGVANTFWRLFLGSMALIPKIQYRVLAVLCIIIGGLATMVSGLNGSIFYQFGFCIIFSMGVASFAVFRLVMLVQLVGAEKVLNGSGICLLFMGVFTIIFPPFFGWLMAVFNSYDAVFITTGALSVLSGLMLINLNKLREKELKRKKRSTIEF